MSRFSYKTTGKLHGKPRVYFSCHPDDFHEFFPELSADILKHSNCVIWYDNEPEVPCNLEDLKSYLSQMQLFIVPVTKNYLQKQNRSLESEFPFAIENHIPILPIVLEKNLEQKFNEKCGNLQYLDKTNHDDTIDSYDEKLKHFLDSVLIGDELSEKIRSAFDAYIFLSYRKKDRKYAQELMRLIHKNDFCRDIAIWYDEFLTPGENFNEAIADALKKSQLFALTVTPNIINETNYIMTTEYPLAKKENKKILTAEMIPTDKELLQEMYQDIPNCISAADTSALARELSEQLKEIAISGNDSSPEHNFFIGLAYLGGIDVEIDFDRALEMITFAAKANLPEAMEKLISMYSSGCGVKKDVSSAIEWQRRLAEYRKNVYETTKDNSAGYSYIHSLWDLGDSLYATDQIDQADIAYRQMKDICTELYCKEDSLKSCYYLSLSHLKNGKIYQIRGDRKRAELYYKIALWDLKKYYKTDNASLGLVASCCENLADLYANDTDSDFAESCYKDALKLRMHAAKETMTVTARRNLSISYSKIGSFYEKKKDYGNAEMYLRRAMMLRRDLVRETKTADSRLELALSYSRLGNIYLLQNKLDESKKCFENVWNIRKDLQQETGIHYSCRDLFVAYCILGIKYQLADKNEEAQECYRLSKSFK